MSRHLGVPRDDSKPGSGRTAVVVWPKGLTVMAFEGGESGWRKAETRAACVLTCPEGYGEEERAGGEPSFGGSTRRFETRKRADCRRCVAKGPNSDGIRWG